MKYLKQKAYCKIDLSDFDVIITPLIWGAMLTGKKIEYIEETYLKRAKIIAVKGNAYKKNQNNIGLREWLLRFYLST